MANISIIEDEHWNIPEKNMNDNRLKQIRQSEKESHIKTYTENKLYTAGGWLSKPIRTVLDLIPLFEGYEELRILDLGAGVGRNCIPFAQRYGDIISPNKYDLVMAISALEHVESKEAFWKKMMEIRTGIRKNGVICLVINSNVAEKDKATGEELSPQFEVNLKTEELQTQIKELFSGWQEIKTTVVRQQYDIPRGNHIAELATDVVTYVARNIQG